MFIGFANLKQLNIQFLVHVAFILTTIFLSILLNTCNQPDIEKVSSLFPLATGRPTLPISSYHILQFLPSVNLVTHDCDPGLIAAVSPMSAEEALKVAVG